MERRVVLAIVLMMLVAIVPSVLFPPKRPPTRPAAARPDSTASVRRPATDSLVPGPVVAAPMAARGPLGAVPEDTVWVESPLYRYAFSTRGARLVFAQLREYRSFAPADSGAGAQLVRPGQGTLGARLVVGADTLALDTMDFTPSAGAVIVGGQGAVLTFAGPGDVSLTYVFRADDYRFAIQGRIPGLGGGGGLLLLSLGDGLHQNEADSVPEQREYAVVTKSDKTRKQPFQGVKAGETTALDGPFDWVAVKSRYFFTAALAIEDSATHFAGAVIRGGPRSGRQATHADVTLTLPVPATGRFGYQVYAGPFEHRRLAALGHGLDDANPYGWSFFRPIIHPVSVWTVALLNWMHERLGMGFGLGLVVFGVLVRVALWPLNQKAMESQLRMQAVQPLMKDIQDRYKSDPERLQREMLKLYKEHKVNPFGGCLPMLLPMPILFAMFFVFSNAIEFRGASFLWLPDLSRHDPYYIIPVLMGLTMFATAKIGQRGMPPNPQTQSMAYVMPVMLTFVFLRLSSGLNLYYAVQNLIGVPQQWWIAERRLRGQGKPPGK